MRTFILVATLLGLACDTSNTVVKSVASHNLRLPPAGKMTSLRRPVVTSHAVQTGASLETQQKCAERATKVVTELRTIEYNRETDVYESHYSATLGKCFVLVERLFVSVPDDRAGWDKTLLDAFELKLYGRYSWRTVAGKKFWEVRPLICSVFTPVRAELKCGSDAEFDELVRVYMEAR